MEQKQLTPEREVEIAEATRQLILNKMTRRQRRAYFKAQKISLKYPGKK